MNGPALWEAHPSRVLASASRGRELFLLRRAVARDACDWKRLFRRDAETNTRDACAPRNKPKWTILHNKFPPTPRVGLVCPMPSAVTDRRHRPALILLFAKKFFRLYTSLWGVTRRAQRDGYRPNEVDRTNILAPGFAFFPPSPPKFFRDWPIGKSYPVTAAQLLPILTGFLAPIHFSKLAKNWIEK